MPGVAADINEANEGKLVSVAGCTFTQTGNFVYTAAGYTVTDGAGASFKVFLRNGHPLIGTPIPNLAVNITGVSSQFDNAALATDNFNTVTTGYQLLPRTPADFVGFFITSAVTVTNLTQNTFDLNWTTNLASTTGAKYGFTPALEMGFTSAAGTSTAHALPFTGLQPAQVVYVRLFSARPGTTDTAWIAPSSYITQSASSGTMQIFVNHPFDATIANPPGNTPTLLTGAAIENKIIGLINAARTTIDCAVYNTNRQPIITALEAAKARGIQVRYVYHIGTANTPLGTTSIAKLGVNPSKLMHNKFMVVDAGSVDSSYVWTGSLNWTDNQMLDDYNNMVLIQDQSLARAYTVEFQEMWGSSGATPNAATSLAGAAKADNTPHFFKIGGKNVQLYFSPSDATDARIGDVIASANSTLEFALLTFTSNNLGTQVRNAKFANVVIRGLVDNPNDQNSQFTMLQGVGVNVVDAVCPGIYHHKFCIVDAANTASDPTVVTGSHNWSSSANSGNDENTLIIHDAAIANQYLQIFNNDWNVLTATLEQVANINGLMATILPNPVSAKATIRLADGKANDKVIVGIYNNLGQQLLVQTADYQAGATQDLSFDVSALPNGSYHVVLLSNGSLLSRTMQVVR
jgi:phosphatidylserine/phosphatidylglycerophosphate/cardiolipin synthase-like enzyme